MVALATQDRLYENMLSNIKELKARGAYVVAIAKEGNKEVEKSADIMLLWLEGVMLISRGTLQNLLRLNN